MNEVYNRHALSSKFLKGDRTSIEQHFKAVWAGMMFARGEIH